MSYSNTNAFELSVELNFSLLTERIVLSNKKTKFKKILKKKKTYLTYPVNAMENLIYINNSIHIFNIIIYFFYKLN